MAATSRIFYQNYLTELSPTVTMFASGGAVANAASGISGTQPVKQGYATGTAFGTYTGIIDRLYRVEIHVEGSGDFGSAQWRWTDDASVPYDDIVWNASNLTTFDGATPGLNNGVSWRFDQGGSFTPQFGLGDYWLFQTYLTHGYQDGLDSTRDHEYRSGTMPATGTIEQRYDFGISVSPAGAVIMDHNIPSNATTQWIATASNFTTVVATTTFTWAPNKMLALITGQTSRYWVQRVTTAGAAPALGYIRWSELFLGASLTMTKQFSSGFRRSRQRLGAVNVDTLRRGPGPYMPSGEILSIRYQKLHAADQARLRALWDWSNSQTFQLQQPFFVLLRDDVLTDFSYYNWANDMNFEHTIVDYYDADLELAEVVRSIA